MTVKCRVDLGRCIGLEICESLAPEYFEVNDEGNFAQLREDISPEDL